MNKTLVKFYAVVLIVMLGMTAFHFFNSADRPDNINGLTRVQAARLADSENYSYRLASGYHFMAGICALLLVGYLFWGLIHKFKTESRPELDSTENSLYDISLATGRTEYDLFHMSAENWSVSKKKIDQDYIRYIADQVLPHYVQDFVRKNRTNIDESLIEKKEVKPTTWSDWAKALLVFPGSLVALYSMMAWL
jgi:hypothetical protein